MSKPATHRAAVVPAAHQPLSVVERQTSSPGEGEVLIKNEAIGVNPIDWKRQEWGFLIQSYPAILGSDVSGTIVEVGSGVTDLKVGDRVFSFAPGFVTGNNDHNAHQEYTVSYAAATGKLPDSVTFEQGATLPTGLNTAAVALYHTLGLPLPEAGGGVSAPDSALLVWGGSGAVGSSTIPLARQAGFKTVIATASPQHHDRLRALGAAAVIDYRSPTVVQDILDAVQQAGQPLDYAIDTIAQPATLPLTAEALSKAPSGSGSGKKTLGTTLPWAEDLAPPPDNVEQAFIQAEQVWLERKDLSTWLTREKVGGWLEEKVVVPMKVRLIEGGVESLQKGMQTLKEGVSGEKVVVKL